MPSPIVSGRSNLNSLVQIPLMARPRAQVDLTALAPVFARSGASGASVDELARACGLAKPTLYERVGGKDELFRATCTAALERMLDRLYEAADRSRYAALPERIAALALELADFDRASARLVLVVEAAPASLGRLRAAISDPLRRESSLAADAADAVAAALLGAFTLAVAGRDPFDADGLAAMLGGAVRAEPEPPGPHWGA
jgi:AcrR family transcriptional regulator